MVSFKQLVLEAIFKSGRALADYDANIQDVKVLINPTRDEFKKFRKELRDARGFIDMKGNLYLMVTSGYFIHKDVLNFLSAVLPIKNADRFWDVTFKEVGGIPIVRVKSTNIIQFSESTIAGMLNDHNLERINLDQAGPILKKAKQKNKTLTFSTELIL